MKRIRLTNRTHFILVDDEDFTELSKHSWTLNKKTGYVINWYLGGVHRYIISPDRSLVVDHINGDKLDNQRHNLQATSQHHNIQKSSLNTANSFNYRGVECMPGYRWRARIRVNGKSKHLGVFDTIHEAALAYNRIALEVYGPTAGLNNVPESVIRDLQNNI